MTEQCLPYVRRNDDGLFEIHDLANHLRRVGDLAEELLR